jgi:AcrR family transcriptional regulator
MKVEDILKAAHKHFEKGGFRKTSINDICTDAGLSKPTFYKYFDSKETLFFATAIYALHEVLIQFQERASELNTATDKLKLFLQLIEEFPLPARVYADEFDSNTGLRQSWITHPLFREKQHYLVDLVERIVLEGIANDEFRAGNPRAIAHALIINTQLIHNLRPASRNNPGLLPTPLHEFVADLILNGIKK